METNKMLFKARSMLFVGFSRASINSNNFAFFQSSRNLAQSRLPDWLNSYGKSFFIMIVMKLTN